MVEELFKHRMTLKFQLFKIFLNNHDWFMIRHEHFNTYMEWKFKSLRIWPSEKSIEREFRLRHFWKFFWDNHQKSFWDSRQMFTLNHPVHHNVIAEKIHLNNFRDWLRAELHSSQNKGWNRQVPCSNKFLLANRCARDGAKLFHCVRLQYQKRCLDWIYLILKVSHNAIEIGIRWLTLSL